MTSGETIRPAAGAAREIDAHCAVIERCNQRGGRMFSVVDLIDAGTMTREQAAYLLAAIGGGASFMIGASPGGAGKTTVMGALLNFVPPDVPLVAAADEEAIETGLRAGRRCCHVCHEIGAGAYHAYLWGRALRRYFDLPAAGHMLAANLHADTPEQARRQICDENGVPLASFRRMNLICFLEVGRRREGTSRRLTAIWESDGAGAHRRIFDGRGPIPPADRQPLVSPQRLPAALAAIDALLGSGARTIREVRTFLVNASACPPVSAGAASGRLNDP
jgi:mono/diheme cytochrome c family protein